MSDYGECLACDGPVFLNDSDSFVTLSNGEGRLHLLCRIAYEADNGAVVCESDNDSGPCDYCAGKGWRWAKGAKHEDDGEDCPDCFGTGRNNETTVRAAMKADCHHCHQPINVSSGRSFIMDRRGAYHRACYTPDGDCDTTCSSNMYIGAGCDCGQRANRSDEADPEREGLRRQEDAIERAGDYDGDVPARPSELARAVAFVESLHDRADAARKGE